MATDVKTCTRCQETKPVSEFGRDKASPDGLSWRCSQCLRELDRARYRQQRKHEPKTLTIECEHCRQDFTYTTRTGPRRKYCSVRCKANAAEAMRIARDSQRAESRRCACGSADVAKVGRPVCPSCRKDTRARSGYTRQRRFALYGITEDEFDELLATQRGRCAVCSTDAPGPRGWFIDHDHACCNGVGSCGSCIRGILCKRCNFILGLAEDSIDLLDAAKKYLVTNSQFKIPLRVVRNG